MIHEHNEKHKTNKNKNKKEKNTQKFVLVWRNGKVWKRQRKERVREVVGSLFRLK